MTTHNTYELAEQKREDNKDAFTYILDGQIVALGTQADDDDEAVKLQFLMPTEVIEHTSLLDGTVRHTVGSVSLIDWYRFMGDNTEDDRMVFIESKVWVPRLIALYKLIFDEVSSFKFNQAVKDWHDELTF